MLLAKFKQAIATAQARGAFVVLARGNAQDALQHALELTLLRGMVRFQANGNYVVNPEKQALVDYYAKSIHHHFASA